MTESKFNKEAAGEYMGLALRYARLGDMSNSKECFDKAVFINSTYEEADKAKCYPASFEEFKSLNFKQK